jgi:hypothetical protein
MQNVSFEDATLACLIVATDEFNWALVREYAEQFQQLAHKEVACRLADFLEQKHEPPTWAALQDAVMRHLNRIGEDTSDTVVLFERLRAVDVTKELPVVKETVYKWRSERVLSAAILEYTEAGEHGSEEEKAAAVKALSVAVAGLDTIGNQKYELRSAFDFLDLEIPANACLLGDDFLCRGDGALYIGPTSGGKSTSSLLQDIYWAAGREAFGIRPSSPLKTLHVQAEDNDKKIKQRVVDIVQAVQQGPKPFTDEELELINQNTIIIHCNDLTGEAFLGQLRQWLRETRPDIVRINPVFSYLGGDASDAKIVTQFLRTGLNPLLSKFNCAAVLVHHPPKPKRADQSEVKISDYSYTGFGSSEFANWARAILAFEASAVYGLFHFVACKPGPSLSWRDEMGRPTPENYFAWDNGSWRQANEDDLRELEEANAMGKNSHKRAGAKRTFNDDLILEPMCTPDGVKNADDLLTKLQAKWGAKAPGRATVFRRFSVFQEQGLIGQNSENCWIRLSSHNGLRDLQKL